MSSAKALNAILPLIASGQPYEAHQKARTFASRYSKSGQYNTAIDVLFQSARELLKAGQAGSGTDLTLFLVDVYETSNTSVTDESRGRLTQLIALTGSAGSWRKTIIDKSVAWSAKLGSSPAGDPDLHHYIGELLYKEGSYDLAEPHLLASGKRDSARLLGEMMSKWAGTGGVPGAFALRGTLPYLLDGNVLAARAFLTSFLSSLISANPSIASSLSPAPIPLGDAEGADEILLTTDPVLNWAQLAVRTCQRAQGDRNKSVREAWVRLCGTYQSKGGLLAQPAVRQVLQEISQLFFAIPPPRTQAPNPFGDMISSLFGGPGVGGASGPAQRRLAPAAGGLD